MCDCGTDCVDCDKIIFSMDSITPLKVHLSAYYKRSFAFFTVKTRMPVILTQLIDSLVRDKESIAAKYGEEAKEELKNVIGNISKLKYEIQTNKPLVVLESTAPDAAIYNDYLEEMQGDNGNPRYFSTIWLYAECFMYRKIKELFENTNLLQNYDYFKHKKKISFSQSLNAIIQLGTYILQPVPQDKVQDGLACFLKLSLWSNKCDLSISNGLDNSQTVDPLELLSTMDEYLLANDIYHISALLNKKKDCSNRTIHIVNDNAAFELFTDLCLADYLITHNFTEKIFFHLKSIPWFISDVTVHDFKWTLQTLINHENQYLKKLGIRWNKYLREGIWRYDADMFWTLPFDYTKMESKSPKLYSQLAEAMLIIFKGDLNYRKLFGEINWDPTTPVKDALQNFKPTNLCVLRTLKADIICGLEKGLAEKLTEKDAEWMVSGNYGVIQYWGEM